MLRAVRLPDAAGGARLQGLRLRGDDRRGARRAAGARARGPVRHPGLGAAARGGGAASTTRPCARAWTSSTSTTRSTSSTPAGPPASPRVRRCRTTTSSTTASSSASTAATAKPIGCASRCPSTTASAWCSATSPAPPTAPASSIPEAAFEPEATLRATAQERCTSLYGVPTMFIAELEHPRFAEFDLSSAADRDHGRLALPRRGDAPRDRADAHARGDHLLRHDRDLAGIDADRRRRRHGATRAHGRARAPPCRGARSSIPRPAARCPAASRASC